MTFLITFVLNDNPLFPILPYDFKLNFFKFHFLIFYMYNIKLYIHEFIIISSTENEISYTLKLKYYFNSPECLPFLSKVLLKFLIYLQYYLKLNFFYLNIFVAHIKLKEDVM